MPRWWRKNWHRVSEEEYRANLTGLNTFFGAVLGFVLADVTTKDPLEFALLLERIASLVCGVLYISASTQRWWYAIFMLLILWRLPDVLPPTVGKIDRLQVTLGVWTLMTILLELWIAWQRRIEARRGDTAV